jgi:hypothetical protein
VLTVARKTRYFFSTAGVMTICFEELMLFGDASTIFPIPPTLFYQSPLGLGQVEP